jgi:hypothetical protein
VSGVCDGRIMVITDWKCRASSLRTQRGLESLTRRSTEPVEIHDAFSKLTIVDGSPWSPNACLVGGGTRVIRTWLGHILTDGLPSSYVSLRDGMSEAAYWGSWDDIWVALEQGEALFGESWVNAIRMSMCLVISYSYVRVSPD